MSLSEAPPLMLCLEKADGQEVTLQIQPSDDFHTFLMKARSLVGYEVDINSITQNQPVNLSDNVYQYLLKNEQFFTSDLNKSILPTANNEDLYILDDGTQIRASQIHFDNEDPHVDLTAEKIPFVKYNDLIDDAEIDDNIETENKLYNIVESPVRYSKDVSSGLVIPFKVVTNNPFRMINNNTMRTGFEAQFTKYLEVKHQIKTYATLNTVTNRNKSPRSLIRDNYKSYDDNYQRNNDDYTHYTREDILNMFKDAPVSSAPCETQNQGLTERRRHARKSDPTRLVNKNVSKPISYIDVDGVLIAESESQNCFICSKFIDNNHDKLYLFDNEDQKLHRSSPQKKLATQLKIICQQCLETNFKPCRKSPNQSLNPDEFLVIRNNQQYIVQKINSNLTFNDGKNEAKANVEKSNSNQNCDTEVKNITVFEEEVAAQAQEKNDDSTVNDDDNKANSSDVVIIEDEPEFDDIDNLEEADEEVIEFLGKYQCDDSEIKVLKCRFCEIIFAEISEVIAHGVVHKHELDDGDVYPCPLCDYGYANFKWLKGHLNAAHGKTKQIKTEVQSEDSKPDEEVKKESPENESPPIARRTRSALRTTDSNTQTESPDKEQDNHSLEPKFEIKMEVKQEALDSSEEEIWIVQAADDMDKQAEMLKCDKCRLNFSSAETLSTHMCRRRGRNRKNKDGDTFIPIQEDFIKKSRKKRGKDSSDPLIVTCHNCNESFTSKVRLKFHMQFHETTHMLAADGHYICTECANTKACIYKAISTLRVILRQFHETTHMLAEDGHYICTECANTKFTTETALFDHVHFQHHKQKRWQCPIPNCGKTFYLRATLTKHSRTHTDTRRYVCGTCGKRFLDKQTLDEHGVTHLRIKPYKCHICLKQLTRRSRLRMHLRAHEEELCPTLVLACAVCSRAFRDHNDANEHLTRSPECIAEFANELKEEEAVTVQLSPTSGLVRHTVQIVESPKLKKPIRREKTGPEAKQLLSTVSDAALPIIRCVEIEKAFRCEYCEDVFYSEIGLNTHRSIHKDVKNPFICHICKVSFATYSRCTTHKTTHGFYKRSLAARKQGNSGTQETGPSSTGILGYGDFPVVKHFLCEDCGRSYLHWTYLQVHRRMKHNTDNMSYKCTQCDVSFVNTWSLSYHRKKQHGKPELYSTADNKPKERDYYRIPCRDCDEMLPNKTALYKHRKNKHSDLSLRINNNNSDNKTANPGVFDCGGRVFWCAGCSRRYASRAGLEAHARSGLCAPPPPGPSGQAHNIARAACAKCSQTFGDVASLHAHLKTSHGHELDYPCEVCAQTFCTRAELSAHARAHIAPNAPTAPAARGAHTCKECGHVFRTGSMLTEHGRVHSGERPFPCDICGVAFRRSTAMRNHRLIHTGVRAWACARCPKRFRIRSDLRTHLRLKHPAKLFVIEVQGLNPTPEEVMERLATNNIPHEKVIEITKMTFPKSMTSIIPHSARALAMLSHVPRTQVACGRQTAEKPFELYQPVVARRGRGISKTPRKPKILQRGDSTQMTPITYSLNVPTSQCSQIQQQIPQPAHQPSAPVPPAPTRPSHPPAYPIAMNVSQEDLSELNVQMLLRDGVLVNGNQMVQLQLNDYNC